jgi:hypothetical protein
MQPRENQKPFVIGFYVANDGSLIKTLNNNTGEIQTKYSKKTIVINSAPYLKKGFNNNETLFAEGKNDLILLAYKKSKTLVILDLKTMTVLDTFSFPVPYKVLHPAFKTEEDKIIIIDSYGFFKRNDL